jgi:hypothetical protein
MKKLIIAALVVMFAATAHATPYLVCDPQDGVTEYEIVDNGNPVFTVDAQADGSLRYDLADIAKGEHSYSVKACNMWGCSEASGIVIIKTVPVAPVLKIEIEK